MPSFSRLFIARQYCNLVSRIRTKLIRGFRDMEEIDIIKNALKRKNTSLSREIQYWVFFKSKILEREENRILFDQKRLTTQQFRKLLKKCARPSSHGPKICRGGSETHRRYARELMTKCYEYYAAILHPESPVCVRNTPHGLGIFLNQSICIKSDRFIFPEQLTGNLIQIGEDEFQELKEADYPSLYDGDRVFVGPLSLINHQCMLEVGFKAFTSTVFAKTFDDIKLKAGEEILINYFNANRPGEVLFKGEECKCKACSN